MIIKKTRKGRKFFGCSNYPNCEFAAWKLEDIKPDGTVAPAKKTKGTSLSATKKRNVVSKVVRKTAAKAAPEKGTPPTASAPTGAAKKTAARKPRAPKTST